MITRPLAPSDFKMLQAALDQDTFVHDTPMDYVKSGVESEVYEDEHGPVMVLRYSKTLRLVAVWYDNTDPRNVFASIRAMKTAVKKAKASGFTEVIFTTESPLLAKFCVEKLGFEQKRNEYVKYVS